MHGSRPTRPSSRAILRAALLFLTTSSSLAHADVSRRHVQLVSPQPYAWDQYGPTNPLAPDGSDYPCKVQQGHAFQVAADGATTTPDMVVGEDQHVSFAGWAVHGGGSCQFALAEGRAPTRDTPWKVLHSVEGGCPKAGVEGNLPEGEDPDTYTFQVPDDFAPGNYTFAWTWVNRIGGAPEFYMNCAPVTVKEAAGSTSRVKERWRQQKKQQGRATARSSSYPGLFLANIGDAGNGCTTAEALEAQVAIAFPYPGDSVEHPNGQDDLFEQPCDGNTRNTGGSTAAAASGGGGGGGGSSSGSGSRPATTTGGGGAAAAAAATTVVASASAAVISGSSSTGAPKTPPYVSGAPASGVSSSSSTSSSLLDSPCTDGRLLCVDGTRFSTCTGGAWDAPQDLAPNTTCVEEGESTGLDTTYHWD